MDRTKKIVSIDDKIAKVRADSDKIQIQYD